MTALAHDCSEAQEDLEHVRAQLLADIETGLRYFTSATDHLDALRAVDPEFASGRDGRDIATHIDNAIRGARAAYAVTHMIIEKDRP